MRKTFLIAIFGLLIFSMAGASAVGLWHGYDTAINGHIYYNGVGVPNVSVSIVCNHSTESGIEMTYRHLVTNDKGFYVVGFNNSECAGGDSVSVLAVKGNMKGANSGTVIGGETIGLPINISNVNVFMTPEFSFYMGLLTLIAAVGVFFVVRKD